MNTAAKPTFAALVAALAMAWPGLPASASEPLAALGSDNFTVLDATALYTQSSTTLTSSSAVFGEYIFGQFSTSYNWSGVSSFGLLMSASGASPDVFFKVELYDSTLTFILNVYEGFASGLSATPTFLPLTILESGTGDLSDVGYLLFGWNGSGPGSVVLHSLAAPVSSIVWSNSGGSAWLSATNWTGGTVPGAGDIAQFGANPTSGVTPVGIDMDSNGGTQSVGAIEVTSSRTAALTIDNSAASAAGTLTLNGATVNGMENVILRNNSTQLFTIANGAAANMNLALGNATENVIVIDGTGDISIGSIISGAARNLTKAGSGAGILTLGAANTFSGSTTVSAGTLRLNSAAGGALGSTTSVAVVSGATLLLAQGDQVNDGAGITLSGGTIARGAGVSETFGDLTVTGSGFLDFGAGATGELRFGTYAPSALLTVYNFLPGNRLVFVGSNLSGSIDDSGFFSFQGGFQSVWDQDTSTFTVTAIPEPSAWLAAALLVVVMVGGSLRRVPSDQ